jgi:hypothetical protein
MVCDALCEQDWQNGTCSHLVSRIARIWQDLRRPSRHRATEAGSSQHLALAVGWTKFDATVAEVPVEPFGGGESNV